MNDERAFELPDEDHLELRPELLRHNQIALLDGAIPRRGRRSTGPYVPLGNLTEHWKEVGVRRRMSHLRHAVESPQSDPVVASALQSYLRGEPDPLGAAAAFQVVSRAGTPLWAIDYLQFDAWLGEHGAEFAVAATAELLAVHAVGSQSGQPAGRYSSEMFAVEFVPPNPRGAYWVSRGVEAHRVRELLAALPETEYRRFRDVFEDRGGNVRQRLLRAFCMPTEQDWVEESCAEWGASGEESWIHQEMLIASVASAEQLATAGITTLDEWGRSFRTVQALLDSVGVGGVPILTETILNGEGKRNKDYLCEVLAQLPSDEAMAFLLDHVVEQGTWQLLREAAERFPQRTLRAIARLADAADPGQRARFSSLVTAIPLVGEAAYAVAEPGVRETIDRLLNLDGVPSVAEEVPEFLASPPWKQKRPKRKRAVVELTPIGGTSLRWAEGERELWAEGGKAIVEAQVSLAEGGLDAVPEVLAALAKQPREHRALPPIGGSEAARLVADWLVRLRSTRASVLTWMNRHGLDAIAWLVPDAVGKAGKQKQAAEAALRFLAGRHGVDAVLASAADYEDEAVAAVKTILDADPLDPGTRKPKAPDWAGQVREVPVLLRGREARLPCEAVEHLVAAMSLDSISIPYAGLDEVKRHCDAASLRAFSWAVFEAWTVDGAPPKDVWAFTQLARFADVETVERLEAQIRRWPGEGLTKRAVNGLEVLGAIESEESLKAVYDMQRSGKSKPLKQAAEDQVELIAAGMGLDAEELADRLVPDFELGEDATLRLDYGNRRFKVGFDEQLRPFVIDEKDKIRKSLPKPGPGDDLEAAGEAKQKFERLKKGLKSVGTEQTKRLEFAMVEGRTWSKGEFQRLLVDHALMWHLAKRLVWQANSETGTVTFRLAEDRTVTDAEENERDLPEDARIRIAHPLLMGGEVETWAEILADYEVLQPFEQLGRQVKAPTEAESKAGKLTRFAGTKSNTGALYGLSKKDWLPMREPSSGWTSGLKRRLRGGGAVEVDIEPGFGGGYYFEAEEVQTIKEVRFPAGQVEAVTISEIIGTLARATRTE